MAHGQSLTLAECYVLAEQHYPMVKQRDLVRKSSEYTLENLSRGYLPQVSIYGQATYQSAVTQIPIRVPGVEIPTLNKDQYKLYGEVNQSIYDGGVIREQRQVQQTAADVEEQKIEVELYKIRERINQLYFGILLVDEQIKQTTLLTNDIQLGLKRAEASFANGIAFKSNVDILKAEVLKADQRMTELHMLRQAYMNMLGLFIDRSLDERTTLQRPSGIALSQDISRPEIKLYTVQSLNVAAQRKLLSARTLPRLSFFIQGGYGRPALNLLSNNFEAYYIGGLRLNWSLGGFYTIKHDKALLEINQQTIDVQRETFLFNTNFTLKQQTAEITKYNALLATDDEIITLRTAVKNSASAQLENGVINSNDYLREVNAEDQARQNKIIHEIQLLMAQYAQLNTTGNSL
jgi:outer membrane protein TolC